MSKRGAFKSILGTASWAALVFILAVGALVLSSLVGRYTYDATGDVVLARVIGSLVFGCFAFSLGIVIGVGNYLQTLRREKKNLEATAVEAEEIKAEIADAKSH